MIQRNVIIYGAGAVGSVLAAAAMQNQDNRVQIHVRPQIRAAIAITGLNIGGIVQLKQQPHFFVSSNCPAKSLFILTVKAYDLEKTILEILPVLTAESCLLLVQNGYGIKELVEKILHYHPAGKNIYQAISSVGATLLSPGEVDYFGGGLRLEPDFADSDFAEIWEHSFINCEYSPDFKKDLWRKLVINSVVNPLTTLLDINNSVLAGDGYQRIKNQVLEESLQIAEAAGYKIDLPIEKFNRFINSDNSSSMRQDLKKGTRSEIDFINGTLVRIAREHGLPAPFNQLLTNLIKVKATSK